MAGVVPRNPCLSTRIQSVPSSVFEGLKRRAQRYSGKIIPLHVGDSHLPPPETARLGALPFGRGGDPDIYAYSPPHGEGEFVDALLHKVANRNGMTWADERCIQITAGATHGLSCAVRSLMNPGDEILLLAPHWPLMRGIAASGEVKPVEVPFSQVLMSRPDADAEGLLESFVTAKTCAIYYSNPNNPDGKLFARRELMAIAEVAKRHNLWVIADEVYENFVFDGEHISIATLPEMAERTITVFSFSKSYALAGLRVGYVVGPDHAIVAIRKMTNHTVYNVPRAMQLAAHRALVDGDEWIGQARQVYRRHRDLAFESIVAPCGKPEGSTYLFLDLSRYCRRGQDSCIGVLERLVDAGLLLTPGAAFGHLYQRWARLCYTSVDEATLVDAIQRVNEVLNAR